MGVCADYPAPPSPEVESGSGMPSRSGREGKVTNAIEAVLNSGRVTADLRPTGEPATTDQVGEAVCAAIG